MLNERAVFLMDRVRGLPVSVLSLFSKDSSLRFHCHRFEIIHQYFKSSFIHLKLARRNQSKEKSGWRKIYDLLLIGLQSLKFDSELLKLSTVLNLAVSESVCLSKRIIAQL